MKFSLFVLPCYRPGIAPSLHQFYEELSEAVRLADRTGWDRVWVSEHHFHYYGGASPNPAMMLQGWARETKRIRLGTGIVLLPLNHPLRSAEDYALVDQMSGGRLDFGVGRGYLPHEFAGFNVGQDATLGKFDEAFDIIKKAWTGEPFAYDGKHYKFAKLRVEPQPFQKPVPIWVACSRSKDSFDAAGREGACLMMNQYPMTVPQMKERFAWYKDAYAAAGHDPKKREAMMSMFLNIGDSEDEAIDEAKLGVQEHANLYRLLFGGDQWSTDYVGDELVFKFLQPDGDVKTLFRERTLIGTTDQICDRIAFYRDQGYTEMSFVIRYGTLPHSKVMDNIDRVNRLIRPRFQARAAA